jgi:hypothetical protein
VIVVHDDYTAEISFTHPTNPFSDGSFAARDNGIAESKPAHGFVQQILS